MGKIASQWEDFRESAATPQKMGAVAPGCSGTALAHLVGMDVISQLEKRLGLQGVTTTGEVSRMVTVPAVEWCGFLERFSRRHRGWLATIHGCAEGLPLTRVRSEALESVVVERCDSDWITRLTLANGISLCAPRPRSVCVQQANDGAEAALEIETAAGTFVRLAFRAMAMPDQLDGVAPRELPPIFIEVPRRGPRGSR